MKRRYRFLSLAMNAAYLLGAIMAVMLTPRVSMAQTPGLPDDWRERINNQLDEQLATLTTIQTKPPAIPDTQDTADDHDFFMQLVVPGATIDARQKPWLPTVGDILGQHGLPVSLVGVAQVESGLNPAALSPKGARGLWQFMPETARRYGLEVEPGRDERLDPIKSTHAAARYIKDLYAQFHDWPLAFAAYNAGENRVERALTRRRGGDFWRLSRLGALPNETRRYVPAVLAKLNRIEFRLPDAPEAAPADNDSKSGYIVYATSAGPATVAGTR